MPQVEELEVLKTMEASDQSFAFLLSDPLPALSISPEGRSLKTTEALEASRNPWRQRGEL